MIDVQAAREIIDTYRKYGWKLRRILVDVEPGDDLAVLVKDVSDVPIIRSDINAAWFSRPPKDVPVAWEIRYLGDPPFALLESLNETDPDFEQSLSRVEDRLHDAISEKKRLDKSGARLQT